MIRELFESRGMVTLPFLMVEEFWPKRNLLGIFKQMS
jgi:hypothetical protein